MTGRTEGERMGSYVLDLQEIDQAQVAVVGGKGAHLGELSRIDGVRVPAGFCVTTDAFRRIISETPSIDDRLDRLDRLNHDDRDLRRVDVLEIQHVAIGLDDRRRLLLRAHRVAPFIACGERVWS